MRVAAGMKPVLLSRFRAGLSRIMSRLAGVLSRLMVVTCETWRIMNSATIPGPRGPHFSLALSGPCTLRALSPRLRGVTPSIGNGILPVLFPKIRMVLIVVFGAPPPACAIAGDLVGRSGGPPFSLAVALEGAPAVILTEDAAQDRRAVGARMHRDHRSRRRSWRLALPKARPAAWWR